MYIGSMTTTQNIADRIEYMTIGVPGRSEDLEAMLISESGTMRIANLGAWLGDEGWVNDAPGGCERDVSTKAEWIAGIEALAVELIAR